MELVVLEAVERNSPSYDVVTHKQGPLISNTALYCISRIYPEYDDPKSFHMSSPSSAAEIAWLHETSHYTLVVILESDLSV